MHQTEIKQWDKATAIMPFTVSFWENKGRVYGKQCHMKRPDMQMNAVKDFMTDPERNRDNNVCHNETFIGNTLFPLFSLLFLLESCLCRSCDHFGSGFYFTSFFGCIRELQKCSEYTPGRNLPTIYRFQGGLDKPRLELSFNTMCVGKN